MSNIPTSYNSNSGPHNTNLGPYQFNQIPPGQLPGSLKQDANSNNPVPQSGFNNQPNHYNQSANSSPAFNHSMMMPPSQPSLQSSPIRPPMKPLTNQNPIQNMQNIPSSSAHPHPMYNSNPSSYPPNQPPRQINDNAPPLIPSSQYQPLMNGPPPISKPSINQYPPSSVFGPPPTNMQPPVNPINQRPPLPMASASPLTSQANAPFSSSMTGPPRNSPLIPPMNAPMTGPNIVGPPLGPPRNNTVNGPPMPGPPLTTMPGHEQPKNQMSGPSSLPMMPMAQQIRPPSSQPMPQPPSMGYTAPPVNNMSGPQSLPTGPLPPMGQAMPGPPGARSNMQNRYPQMPPSNFQQQSMSQGMPPQGIPQGIAPQGIPQGMPPQGIPQGMPPQGIPQGMPPPGPQMQSQNRMPGLTQQMGQLSVTQQGFDQLWGHQMVDLMQCKHILSEYPEDPPEIRLGPQFADAPNCSPEIFRCTINRIPESNSLLQKSRLPLGILIHPFKDLNHLPVIQCTTIVRCRACRTYINPFVYFVDAKRWKCNLCYRVNDLPEEFQYDPVSKSYGDPTRRPEIKSATIEFIAPSEYMLRPPQPAVYLFLFDVSQIARESGYLRIVCDVLKSNLEQLPGDARTQIGFICYDAHIHYYLMSDDLTKPKEMTVLDIDEVFLPSPESLLVNLGEHREMVRELLALLPDRFAAPGAPASALGAALQAAYKLMAPTGGRITVFQTCLPNIGPGALQSREDPNARSSKDVQHLSPATDFYKRLALDCSGAQVAVDLFLLSSQYCDLATLSGMSKFSAGTVYHMPVFLGARAWQAAKLAALLARYLTRKIGFEAVMRVRCTRGISIHTFHGNFFVRSTDLLSLPNVSPDAGFGMQLAIDESLGDLQHACFQAALLYTSSKGERRIRVHTMAIPIANTLPDVLHAADQHCIVGLLSKMAVDRCVSASMAEAREALMTVAVDVLGAARLAHSLPAGPAAPALFAPRALRLLPLYLLALLKTKALRTGTSTRLDERVAAMCELKCLPLAQLLRLVYPDLYPIHTLAQYVQRDDDEQLPHPPRMQLTSERINLNGAYLLDDGETMMIYVCNAVSPAFLSEVFGVTAFSQLPDEAMSIPKLENDGNELLHAFIEKLNDDRPYPSNIVVFRDNSPTRSRFTERLIEDRVESAFSYYEFLQHIKTQVK
ncbi:protein transport protein Sec24A [Zerene cesonia]|uniref:protein transport protein Sec24A n=1 Tax=Zerene cesonia TaxID=33412 RepID=UPI0018E57824|nr:protein transport protein Sec24A [Zerene cesonia]